MRESTLRFFIFLGLEDVSDLDYSEYKTLLKERLVQNRMNTDQGAREDTANWTKRYSMSLEESSQRLVDLKSRMIE